MEPSYSAAEVADAIDKAHDELLVRGWCQDALVTPDGRRCMLGAVNLLGSPEFGWGLRNLVRDSIIASLWMDGVSSRYMGWSTAVVAGFNDRKAKSIDDVLDAFRLAAKRVRDGIIDPHNCIPNKEH